MRHNGTARQVQKRPQAASAGASLSDMVLPLLRSGFAAAQEAAEATGAFQQTATAGGRRGFGSRTAQETAGGARRCGCRGRSVVLRRLLSIGVGRSLRKTRLLLLAGKTVAEIRLAALREALRLRWREALLLLRLVTLLRHPLAGLGELLLLLRRGVGLLLLGRGLIGRRSLNEAGLPHPIALRRT